MNEQLEWELEIVRLRRDDLAKQKQRFADDPKEVAIIETLDDLLCRAETRIREEIAKN